MPTMLESPILQVIWSNLTRALRRAPRAATVLFTLWLIYLRPIPDAAPQTAPRIELIERFSSNQVIVHFDTEANKSYTLQSTASISCRANAAPCPAPDATWTNVFLAPLLPFPNHYVIPDTRTS